MNSLNQPPGTPYHSLFEDACESIFVFDAHTGHIAEANAAGCRLLSCSRGDVVGRSFVEFLESEGVPRSHTMFETVSLGQRYVSQCRLRTKRGEWLPVEISAMVTSTGHCQAFVRDLRAQRAQELAAKEREAARHAEDQVIATHQRVLVEVGETLVREGMNYPRALTGIARVVVREMAEWCALNLVFEGDDVRRVCVVTRDTARRAACESLEEIPVNRKTAPVLFDVIDSQRPLVIDNAPAFLRARGGDDTAREHFIATLRPMTMVVLPLVARRRTLGTMSLGSTDTPRTYGTRELALLERLAQALALGLDNGRLHAAAKRAVKARDDLLGIVAHDLRNPLSSIALQSAKIAAHTRDARICERAAKRIQDCVRHMDRLIQDLLDLSRLEAGQRLAVSVTPVSPACMLAEATEQQCMVFSMAKRTLTVEATADLPHVMADRGRIGQVIGNLLSNARKFSEKQVHMGARMQGDAVLFFVRNDGPPIPAADVPHLFERFWQAKHARRRGTGLGLSIVQEVVTLHGGRVWVESAAGTDTTFYFTLPCAPPEKTDAPAPVV